jgi:hypothetical protein
LFTCNNGGLTRSQKCGIIRGGTGVGWNVILSFTIPAA